MPIENTDDDLKTWLEREHAEFMADPRLSTCADFVAKVTKAISANPERAAELILFETDML